MGYQNSIEKDFPYSFYSADTISGATPVAPLVTGSGQAAVVDGTTSASFYFPGFTEERKSHTFSLEVWFLPVSVSQETIVLGHAEGDGVLWDGEFITFRVADVEVSYAPSVIKTFHVIGTYTSSGLVLYVNGEQVASHVFSETENLDWPAVVDPTTLVSGPGGSIIIDAVAFYTTPIKPNLPRRHYEMGQTVTDIMRGLDGFGGQMVELRSNNVSTFLDRTWAGGDWSEGVSNVDYRNGYLEGTGTWMVSALVPTGTNSSVIEWEGWGIVVEASSDATNWTVCTNGEEVPVTWDEDVQIRITLNGGEMHKLRLALYADQEIFGGERALSIDGAVSDRMFYPINNLDHAGLNGTATLEPSILTEPTDTYAVEFWVKPDTSTLTLPTGTAYINGSTTGTLRAGEWNHVIVTFAASNAAISFAQSRYGLINYYNRALSATDVQTIYNSYFGKAGLEVVIPAVTIQESDPAWDLYAYEWSISRAGG